MLENKLLTKANGLGLEYSEYVSLSDGGVSEWGEKAGASGLTRTEIDVLYGVDWLDSDVLAVKAGLPRPARAPLVADPPKTAPVVTFAAPALPRPREKTAEEIEAEAARTERKARLRALGVDLDARTVSGYAATAGRNRRGTAFWPEAFDEQIIQLAHAGKSLPWYLNHEDEKRLGETVELLNDGRGLFVTFRMAEGRLHDQILERISERVEAGVPPGLSVSIDRDSAEMAAGVCYRKATILEISLLWGVDPACPDAFVGPPDSASALKTARESLPGQIKSYWQSKEDEWQRNLLDIEWRDRINSGRIFTR